MIERGLDPPPPATTRRCRRPSTTTTSTLPGGRLDHGPPATTTTSPPSGPGAPAPADPGKRRSVLAGADGHDRLERCRTGRRATRCRSTTAQSFAAPFVGRDRERLPTDRERTPNHQDVVAGARARRQRNTRVVTGRTTRARLTPPNHQLTPYPRNPAGHDHRSGRARVQSSGDCRAERDITAHITTGSRRSRKVARTAPRGAVSSRDDPEDPRGAFGGTGVGGSERRAVELGL